MSKKNSMYVRWDNTKKVIPMGSEIERDKLANNTAYSILKLSKGEGKLIYDWGIVITDSLGELSCNWNINQQNRWDRNNVTIKKGWRIFDADAEDAMFAQIYLKATCLDKQLTKRIDEINDLHYQIFMLEHRPLIDRIKAVFRRK